MLYVNVWMRETSIELFKNEEQLHDNRPGDAPETNYVTNYTPTDAYTAVNPGCATTDGAALNSQGELEIIGSSRPSSSVLIRALAQQPPPPQSSGSAQTSYFSH